MPPEPHVDQFAYVHLRGEGNKGVSYKYTWRPEFKLPPGVKASKVAMGVAFWLSLAAVPVFVWPAIRGPKSEEELKAKKPNIYARIKEQNKEERLRWIQAPEMPPR